MGRFVAPAGAPLEIGGILGALKASYSTNASAETCFSTLAERLQVGTVLGVSSGRAALTLILRSLHRLRPERTVVAVPGYTCFTVAASVVRSGLKLLPLDINPLTLDFKDGLLETLHRPDLLCIVTSNLFGLINDVARIQEAANRTGAYVVDDAAQAMGATLDGRFAGTFGDVGFFSFGRGKALAALEGGLIITSSDRIAGVIREESEKLPACSIAHSGRLVLEMMTYAFFLHPRLYWLPNSLPFLSLGTTVFDPEFPEFTMPGVVRELLLRLETQLEEFNKTRRHNASVLSEGLKDCLDFTILRPIERCVPNYIRFPLMARDQTKRDRAVQKLQAAGIGASAVYPSGLCDIKGIRAHLAFENMHQPGALDVARRLMALPTHPYVRSEDLQQMIEILRTL